MANALKTRIGNSSHMDLERLYRVGMSMIV